VQTARGRQITAWVEDVSVYTGMMTNDPMSIPILTALSCSCSFSSWEVADFAASNISIAQCTPTRCLPVCLCCLALQSKYYILAAEIETVQTARGRKITAWVEDASVYTGMTHHSHPRLAALSCMCSFFSWEVADFAGFDFAMHTNTMPARLPAFARPHCCRSYCEGDHCRD
jgi:hypothetical protein